MHTHTVEPWAHEHVFLGARHDVNERRTWWVVALTAVMMVGEIAGGTIYGSMALVADGWHMSTHAGALAIAALAYWYARRRAKDSRFTFGTGKLGELAGYSSALILAVIALMIGYESVMRLLNPVTISFDQAIAIASVGLVANLVSAWLLHDHDEHDHAHEDHEHQRQEHDHDHEHESQHTEHAGAHHHHDHNLRAAYLHVLADALTSVLAIAALLAGRFYGWVWMDPAMGIVGALVISHWSFRLLRASGAVLVDVVADERLANVVRERLEVGSDRVTDLHLWRVGPGHAALIASLVSDEPQSPDHYKARLASISGLSHVTIEVHPCPEAH